MNARNDELIQNEIIKDIEDKFSWRIRNVRPNYLGYGNLKWIFETENDELFVKQYNKIRYRRGLDGVREALKYQNLMHLDGIACQPVHSYKGEYIHSTSYGEEYMISGVSTGRLAEAGKLNSNQMYSLGEAAGRMHLWMKKHMPQLNTLQWELPSKEKMFEKLAINLAKSKKVANKRYLEAIEKQMIILEQLDMEIFNRCNKGWAHWDMHIDNMLFYENKLADVLDFDRLHFVYQDFDISRAILSGALSNDKLNIDTAKAYIEGYRNFSRISLEQLVRSIKLTWYKEFKWVDEQFRQDKAMSRFIDEMIWIGDEWNNLEEIFNM
ncbi:homoserine kinase type II [Paenibacillus taihuensis]|uniref:Homoserine kinase type II n=1 Tax=Paenibacillus taihuensis TaxID=1156355 RepID=A0A3D9QWN1_9BACL|nr:phosphotransferase [Paenibacillus taihuensis]REE69634.1 homoserine kinase type II [Paenibacillus taihuensis]